MELKPHPLFPSSFHWFRSDRNLRGPSPRILIDFMWLHTASPSTQMSWTAVLFKLLKLQSGWLIAQALQLLSLIFLFFGLFFLSSLYVFCSSYCSQLLFSFNPFPPQSLLHSSAHIHNHFSPPVSLTHTARPCLGVLPRAFPALGAALKASWYAAIDGKAEMLLRGQ